MKLLFMYTLSWYQVHQILRT